MSFKFSAIKIEPQPSLKFAQRFVSQDFFRKYKLQIVLRKSLHFANSCEFVWQKVDHGRKFFILYFEISLSKQLQM